MNIFRYFDEKITATCLEVIPGLTDAQIAASGKTLEVPRDPAHGDLSTNAAMVLARPAGGKPREIAEHLAPRIREYEGVESVEIAGPGFINLRLTPGFWRRTLGEILREGARYGASAIGAGTKVNIEYVSANPTGPMHVGHTRGAVFGDALASLMRKAGFEVTREYYINDAGAQIKILAESVFLRYREALGEKIGEIPEGLYPGDYLIPVGEAIVKKDGGKWLSASEDIRAQYMANAAVMAMMTLIKDDLASLNIRHDGFFSERILHSSSQNAHRIEQEEGYFSGVGFDIDAYYAAQTDPDKTAIQEAVDALEARGLIYTGVLEPPKGKPPEDWEPRPQMLFRATQFGDDVDRPLKKSTGEWTYFAADIAYHYSKFQRGFSQMIDVFGADHGGYVKRTTAAVAALTDGKASLDIKICQLVRLLRDGEQVKMSKRSGNFVTLREVVDEVGPDAVRFMMLFRKNDAPLDFDFAKVTEQSKDNPVFYVQYAHARICSVLRNVQEVFPEMDWAATGRGEGALDPLQDPDELSLIRMMASWPRMVESAAAAHEPHRIAFFVHELASAFHGLWNRGNDNPQLRFILSGSKDVTLARIALIRAVQMVIASALEILGVEPVEEMR